MTPGLQGDPWGGKVRSPRSAGDRQVQGRAPQQVLVGVRLVRCGYFDARGHGGGGGGRKEEDGRRGDLDAEVDGGVCGVGRGNWPVVLLLHGLHPHGQPKAGEVLLQAELVEELPLLGERVQVGPLALQLEQQVGRQQGVAGQQGGQLVEWGEGSQEGVGEGRGVEGGEGGGGEGWRVVEVHVRWRVEGRGEG